MAGLQSSTLWISPTVEALIKAAINVKISGGCIGTFEEAKAALAVSADGLVHLYVGEVRSVKNKARVDRSGQENKTL